MYQLTEFGVLRLADEARIPPDPANTDYANYLAWLAEGNTPLPIPAKSEEELATEAREAFKAQRALDLAAIKVTSSLGRTFDGGEVDTQRMLEPVAVLKEKPIGTTWLWVLADNTPVQVALPEFLEVLELAGREKTRLWLQPN